MLLEHKANKVYKVYKANRAYREFKANREFKEFRAKQELKEKEFGKDYGNKIGLITKEIMSNGIIYLMF